MTVAADVIDAMDDDALGSGLKASPPDRIGLWGYGGPTMTSDLLADLKSRNLLHDCSSEGELAEHLRTAPRTAYVGFDPTADSLHIGSLLPLLAMRRLQLAGHRPIILVGGATGLIGDPSGKANERTLNPVSVVEDWTERITAQVSRFVDLETGGPNRALVVNNHEWLGGLSAIELLRDVGKHFSIGTMLGKESIRSRMSEGGISFTEFSYLMLQAYDFLCLRRRFDCAIQIGGSDQWGNITAGIDLIRRLDHVAAFGLTLPLVTRTDGAKFGKTEAGTIWLDARRTSPYAMYQFWLNTPDQDVVRFLRYFTFLPAETTADLAEAVEKAPGQREAQRALARDVTGLVHGEASVRQAERISTALFSGQVSDLVDTDLTQLVGSVPGTELPSSAMAAYQLVDVVALTGLAPSRSRARDLIQAGGLQVNGQAATDPAAPASSHVLFGQFMLIRRGQKTYHLVRCT